MRNTSSTSATQDLFGTWQVADGRTRRFFNVFRFEYLVVLWCNDYLGPGVWALEWEPGGRMSTWQTPTEYHAGVMGGAAGLQLLKNSRMLAWCRLPVGPASFDGEGGSDAGHSKRQNVSMFFEFFFLKFGCLRLFLRCVQNGSSLKLDPQMSSKIISLCAKSFCIHCRPWTSN